MPRDMARGGGGKEIRKQIKYTVRTRAVSSRSCIDCVHKHTQNKSNVCAHDQKKRLGVERQRVLSSGARFTPKSKTARVQAQTSPTAGLLARLLGNSICAARTICAA